MWINLDDKEVEAVLRALSSDKKTKPLAEQIKELIADRKDPLNGKYVSAVETVDGELEVDDDAVVSRGGDPGAYVMCWTWVSNEQAGVTPEESNVG